MENHIKDDDNPVNIVLNCKDSLLQSGLFELMKVAKTVQNCLALGRIRMFNNDRFASAHVIHIQNSF